MLTPVETDKFRNLSFTTRYIEMESSESPTSHSQYLLVIDFDHTISEKNTDTEVLKSLLSKEKFEEVFAKRQKSSWQEVMKNGFRALHDGNHSKDQIINSIEDIPLVNGFVKFIELVGGHSHCEIMIASDSNSVFIETLLQKHKLVSYINHVFTNPAHFDSLDHLQLFPHHSHSCQTCEPNICKQEILRQHLERAELHGHKYETIFVIGDGSNDFCPCKILKEKDIVFPRKGYRLMKKLEKLSMSVMGESSVRASVVPWKDGEDLLTSFKQATCLDLE